MILVSPFSTLLTSLQTEEILYSVVYWNLKLTGKQVYNIKARQEMRKMEYLTQAFEKLTVLIISTFSILSCTGNKILCGACLWNWAMYHDVLYCSSQASHYLGTKEQIPTAPSSCMTNKEWLCQDTTLAYPNWQKFSELHCSRAPALTGGSQAWQPFPSCLLSWNQLHSLMHRIMAVDYSAGLGPSGHWRRQHCRLPIDLGGACCYTEVTSISPPGPAIEEISFTSVLIQK